MQSFERMAQETTSDFSERLVGYGPEVASVASAESGTLATPPAEDAEEKQRAVQTLLATLEEIARNKQSVEETMALLLHETREARRRTHRRVVGWMVLAVLCLWMQLETPGLDWMILLFLIAWTATDRRLSNRRNLAQKLRRARDPRAVGVLAVALRDGDVFVRQMAEMALRDLLPRVHASDAASFDAEQREALLDLAYRKDTGLKIALLKALEQIGDERAIAAVLYLHNDPVPRVREQAQVCLQFVTERLQRAQESATLLRPAAQAPVPTDQLLRPASDSPHTSTPPEQLLRPLE